MKFKNICKFAAALTLPFTFISCGEKEEEKDSGDGKTEEPAAKTHTEIGTEMSAVMSEMIATLSTVTDVESAKSAVEKVKGLQGKAQSLAEAATTLDPPTDEEKANIKAMKDATDAAAMEMGAKMGALMQDNPDAEAISAVLDPVMEDEDFNQAMDSIKEVYGFED